VNHPQIAVFARLAKENTPPLRAIEGEKTKISRTMHGFGYDEIHDEIVVTSPLTQAILVFRGSAGGEEPPLRVIQGPNTQIIGTAYGGNSIVSVDGANSEIYLPVSGNSVLVFDRMANGDVPPKRVLKNAGGAVAIDPMRNLLILNRGRALQIFDRTASGEAKPIRVIEGDKAGVQNISSFQTYPEKGWIIGGCTEGSICAWSVTDSGNAAPRWKIPVQELTGYVASGIALDPVHKEILLSAAGQRVRPPSGIMNTVITFSWPEIF
jgi:hypothetical protein